MIAADLHARIAANGCPLPARMPASSVGGEEIGNAEPNHLRVRLLAAATDDLIVDREHAPGVAAALRRRIR